jgi:hypothetical protein
MYITLEHPSKTSDHGPNLKLTEPVERLSFTDEHYEYIKSIEGVFRRSVNYWYGSPYGWKRILPNHMDKWGMQS